MKREREKHITRLHLILVGLLVVIGLTVLIVFKVKNSNKEQIFKTFEKSVSEAASDFYGTYEIDLDDGQVETITIEDLEIEGFLNNEMTSKCDGYVRMSKVKNIDKEYEPIFESFVKCGNYKSNGYEEEYAKSSSLDFDDLDFKKSDQEEKTSEENEETNEENINDEEDNNIAPSEE